MIMMCGASSCNKGWIELAIRVEAGLLLIAWELVGAELEDEPSLEPALTPSAASKENSKESSTPIGKDIDVKISELEGFLVTTTDGVTTD